MTGWKWILATAALTTAISGSALAESHRWGSRRDDGNYAVQYDRDHDRYVNRSQAYNYYGGRDYDRDSRVFVQRDRDRDSRVHQRRDSDDWNRR